MCSDVIFQRRSLSGQPPSTMLAAKKTIHQAAYSQELDCSTYQQGPPRLRSRGADLKEHGGMVLGKGMAGLGAQQPTQA